MLNNCQEEQREQEGGELQSGWEGGGVCFCVCVYGGGSWRAGGELKERKEGTNKDEREACRWEQ